MKTTITICTLLVAASLTAQSRDQGQYDVKETSHVASAALPSLRGLAEKVPAVVGLTADEAATAELGQPLQLFDVGLDALKNYQAGSDPQALLHDARTVHFPILVHGEVRSSIVVKQKAQGWVATDFGQVELAKRVSAARGTAPDAFLVRVPALNTYLVGSNAGGTLRLTPIADIPGTDLRENQPAPAGAVFAALAARARQSNGLPT